MTLNIRQDDDLPSLLTHVGRGEFSARAALSRISPQNLTACLHPTFTKAAQSTDTICTGQGILSGDVTGVLVLSRELAEEIIKFNEINSNKIKYIYGISEGNIDDFIHIKHADGFITCNHGKTTFSPVQAVQEGVPTIIGLPIEFLDGPDEPRLIDLENDDGERLSVHLDHHRSITSPGGKTILSEGDIISMSGTGGTLHQGKRERVLPVIPHLYDLLIQCYLAAKEQYGASDAWKSLSRTPLYAAHREEIEKIIKSDLFVGFQKVKELARKVSPLKIFVNVHDPECVIWARLVASDFRIENGGLTVDTDERHLGVGLLRDERMWIDGDAIDLLRALLLGPGICDKDRYEQIRADYVRIHSEALYQIFSAGTGQVCVARILCMPFSKFLPDDFDFHAFSERHGFDTERVQRAFRVICGEREVYHGCRGIRLFCLREELAESWITALLTAARRTIDAGVPLKLRILLATLTLPEEVERFFQIFDRVAPEILGEDLADVVKGVSSMLETAGAYIDLERIFSQKGRQADLNGGLIGTNDFTSACLNMNRGDSPRTIIPGYVEKKILSASPFMEVHPIVGKAIVDALQRCRQIGRENGRDYLWGLAGELSYSWEAVKWCSLHAAPAGLNYVTTSPETMIFTLFAASSPFSGAETGASNATVSALPQDRRAAMELHVRRLEHEKTALIDELRSHNFLRRCREGQVHLDELKAFLVQQGLYSAYFTRYLCALMSNLSSNKHILDLAQNLFEELGLHGNNSRPHHIIYREMLNRFSLTLEHQTPFRGTSILTNAMFRYCRNTNPSFGLGALCLGAEALVPGFYSDIMDGFIQCGVPEEHLEFFTLHIDCDDSHAETIRDIMATLATETPDEIENMVVAGRELVMARRAFLSSIEASSRKSETSVGRSPDRTRIAL